VTNVEDIEGRIKQLNSEELRELREWFASFDGEVWDAQIASDIQSGKLDKLAARALRDYEAGHSTEL
jgi:hypothetical protein